MKNIHQHEMQQIIIYLNKQFSRVLFPGESLGITPMWRSHYLSTMMRQVKD
jgi:hypothetical protein